MRTMAILAVLIGVAEAANALAEGRAWGIANGGFWLAEVSLTIVAGALLLAAGILMLRRAPGAVRWAQAAAITCLTVVVLSRLVQPWMSIFGTLLGIVFPIALLFYLRWTRGRGLSATTTVLVFLLILGLPVRSPAQEQVRDTTRINATVRDLPLSAAHRQSYAGSYSANLPQGGQSSILVFEESGVLKLRVSDTGETRRLLYQGDNIFLADNTPDFGLTFVMNGGRATGFNVRKADDGLIVAVRIH